jgi:hypothetical protein
VEDAAVRVEVLGQVVRGLADSGADDEREPGVLDLVQVRRGQHAGVGDDHDVVDCVSVLERAEHGQQRERLAGVSGELVNLKREPVRGDQHPHQDLRVDAALLAHPHLPQRVLVLGLEVERGHVVEHQLHVPMSGRMRIRSGRELVPPIVFNTSREGPPDRPQPGRRHPELAEHPDRVSLARRLDHASEDQLHEHVVIDSGIETEPPIRGLQHVPQHPRTRSRHGRRRPGRRSRCQRVQIERLLPGMDLALRNRHQRRKLRVVMRRADVLEDRLHSATSMRDLHRRRPGTRLHLPDEQPHRGSLNRRR